MKALLPSDVLAIFAYLLYIEIYANYKIHKEAPSPEPKTKSN